MKHGLLRLGLLVLLAALLSVAQAHPQSSAQRVAAPTGSADSSRAQQQAAAQAQSRSVISRIFRKPATPAAPATKPKQEPVQQQPDPNYGSPRLSTPFPNPASTEVKIEYTFGQGQNATLTIYDFLGKPVRTMGLRQGSNSILLDVANLQPGIYFYSLEVDGKLAATKRLSISR